MASPPIATTAPIAVPADGDEATDALYLRERLSVGYPLSLADVMTTAYHTASEAAPELAEVASTICRETPLSQAQVACRAMSLVAGNGDAFGNVLTVAQQRLTGAAEANISANEGMPEEARERVRKRAQQLADELAAAPVRIADAGRAAYPHVASWLGRPAVLRRAVSELDAGRRGSTEGTTRGRDFEKEAVEWAQRRFPGAAVVANAHMDVAELREVYSRARDGKRPKGEVDALVLSRPHVVGVGGELGVAMAAAVGICRDVDALAQRVVRLRERVDRLAASHGLGGAHGGGGERAAEAERRAELDRRVRRATDFATGLGPVSPSTAQAIVEAKCGTNSLADDVKKCFELRSCLETAKRSAYKAPQPGKSKVTRDTPSVPFRMPRGTNKVPVHVCVSESPGTTLLELFSRATVMQSKVKLNRMAAARALGRPAGGDGRGPDADDDDDEGGRGGGAGDDDDDDDGDDDSGSRASSGSSVSVGVDDVIPEAFAMTVDEDERDGSVNVWATLPAKAREKLVAKGVQRLKTVRHHVENGDLFYWVFRLAPSAAAAATAAAGAAPEADPAEE